MKLVALQEIAQINPSGPRAGVLNADDALDFLPMSDVSELGTMTITEQRPYREVQKGYTAFQDGDVLIAKITPCYENNKITVAKVQSRYGFGSTEFHVIRPLNGSLDARYLFHFVRQDTVRLQGEKRMTGSAGQRRVPKTFLQHLEIPLPRLADQKRIAAILDQADELRRLRQESLDRLNNLSQAIFHEMFGGSVSIPALPLGKIADLKRGPFGGALKKEIFVASGYKVYEQGNAIKRDLSYGKYFIDQLKFNDMKSFSVEPNDLIVSCSGTLGRTYRIPEGAPSGIINQALLRIRVDEAVVSAKYLEAFFTSPQMQEFLGGFARGTGLQNFPPMSDVKAIKVPLPTIEAQIEFFRRMEAVEKINICSSDSASNVDLLFASLQHRAFRGEL